MKKYFLFIVKSIAVLALPLASMGQAPALWAASSFSLFTAVGAVNNSGPTIVNGDIGINAGAFSGFTLG
jgi:hypothetical protein